MGKENGRKYSYTISLAVSIALVAFAWGSGTFRQEERSDQQISSGIGEIQMASAYARPEKNTEDTAVVMKMAETEVGPETETEEIPEEETDTPPEMYEAELSYFDDALFIGDSRTVGLWEYGDLGNAEVVADSGMSVYKIFTKKLKTVSGEKKLLETVLTEKQFGKIYLMLGINELGYDYDHTMEKYEKLIQRIRELQPDALIFLEANLHITSKKSESSPVYTNEGIDRFNEAMAGMADDRTIFYLDANELFDDENGSLAEEYTGDDVHIRGKYYPDWVAWLLAHARRVDREEPEPADSGSETVLS